MTAPVEYSRLVQHFAADSSVVAGQMFGKPCLKLHGKAFIAQHKDSVVFKVTGAARDSALSCPGATLWDPSGKGRAMKEWVAVPATSRQVFPGLAAAAYQFVEGSR